MRFAYADPPYPGLARRYYRCAEVDHVALVARLMAYPDGWALSTSAAALPNVLRLCPERVRVAAWVRGARPARSRWPLNAWEPVIVLGGRPRVDAVQETRTDVLTLGASARARSHPDALVGMKPAGFATWVFELLGAAEGDELCDMFPGSGAVSRAWECYLSTSVAEDLRDASARPRATRRAGAARRLAGTR